ncbi:MAG TPA: DUF3794 domain-containing protein [Clostridiales bacterium]|nr:DUF3794 domain-containing protein [Clostridiales bacterium]
MEYVLSKKELSVGETVFEGCIEQPIDLDFSLPDYCPDIQRILKCRVYPKIYTRNISGDRLDIEGTAIVKILYLDAIKKSVRSSEHSVPFTSSFNMKTTPQNAVATSAVKPEYLNCRALSPRRLDIHGAFSICATVISKCEKEFAEGIDGDDVQVKTTQIPVSALCGLGQQQFTVEDSIVLGSSKPPIEAVLRTDMQPIVSDIKAITNKLMIKGDIGVKVLYMTDLDTGNTEVLEYTMPFSQILDVDGVTDSCACDVTAEILTYEIHTGGDAQEKNQSIDVEVKMVATSVAYSEEEITVVSDAYSTMYDLDLVFNQTPVNSLASQPKETCITKTTVEIGTEGITKVIDLWNEQCTATAMVEEGQLMAKGKVNVCVLAEDREGTPFYTERIVDFTYPMGHCDIAQPVVQTAAAVSSISYRLNGTDNLDLRIEIKLSAPVFDSKVIRCVSQATANEEHLRQRDHQSALTLYYAGDGESLWSIAREYAVSCDAVMAENDLTDDTVLQGRMLLIPNI